MRRPAKFLLVGAWNTAFGYLAFVGLYAALGRRVHYLLVLVLAQVMAVTNAYLSYKWGVFRTKGYVWGEYLRFWTVYLYTFAANFILLPLFVQRLHLGPILAQGILTALGALAGYLGHSRFTFASNGLDRDSMHE